MRDEIKEILDNIEVNELKHNKWYCSVGKDNMQKILDYITNLQQEINKLTAESTEWESKCYDLQQENDMLKQGVKDTYDTSQEMLAEKQQENERLKEQLEYLRSGEYFNQVKWERDLNENLNQTLGTELEDYKSRCEKAIEYIENTDDFDIEIFDESSGGCLGTDLSKGAKNLLNILQNGGESK